MDLFAGAAGQGIFETAAYVVGKAVAFAFLPHLGIEPLQHQKSMPFSWASRNLTYRKDGRRFLYTESIQLIGTAVLLTCAVGLALMVHYAT
jgi:hypothetical protein